MLRDPVREGTREPLGVIGIRSYGRVKHRKTPSRGRRLGAFRRGERDPQTHERSALLTHQDEAPVFDRLDLAHLEIQQFPAFFEGRDDG